MPVRLLKVYWPPITTWSNLSTNFSATVHALGRPAVCVSNAWGHVAEFVADSYRCINYFHGFLFACVGSDVTTLVLIKIIGEIA